MSKEISVTGTTSVSLGTVDSGKSGLSVVVRLSGDLDSGTVTIGVRPTNSSGVKEILDATLILGGSATYTVGEGMELFAVCSGSSADIKLLVSQYT